MPDQHEEPKKLHPGGWTAPIRLAVDECVYPVNHVVPLCVRSDDAHLRTAHPLARPDTAVITAVIDDEMVAVLRTGQAKVWTERAPISGGAVAEVCRAADIGGLVAVAPLIAARTLRQAAEFVRDDVTGAFVHGDHCVYALLDTCDCERGITYRWLLSRSRGRCGKDNPHKAGYACYLDADHTPVDDHRFGPVAS